MEWGMIRSVIASDKKDEFLSFLKQSSVILIARRNAEIEMFYKLLEWTCNCGAVHCATALIEGKTDLKVDLKVPNNHDGALPLHVAASSLSPGLIELFLCHGAEANVRCHNAVDGLLPLHIALERASADKCLSHWTPKHSIFKLIIMLCLPEMKEAMETCRLLALNTKDIKEVICSYVKEGKFIELAILMMVARKKVMDPITLQSKDGLTLKECMTFRQWVKSELAALIDEEYFFMGMKEEKQLIRTRKEKKVAMISTLLLVEIFERVGDTFEAYLQSKQNVPKEHVAGEIAWLLAEAGFILNCKDVDLSDVFDSWQTNLVLERSGGPFHEDEEHSERKICDSQQDHICNQPYSPPGSSLDTNNESLETVSMLSVRTREVDDVLYHYAKEGKLVQLAALLMVAPDTNAPPTKDDGSIALRRVVASEIASLIDTEHMFLGHRSRKQAKMLKEKKRVMSTVMLLVEILQRTAGSIKSDARSRNKIIQVALENVELNGRNCTCHPTCRHTILSTESQLRGC